MQVGLKNNRHNGYFLGSKILTLYPFRLRVRLCRNHLGLVCYKEFWQFTLNGTVLLSLFAAPHPPKPGG